MKKLKQCKPNELINVFDKSPNNGVIQNQFDTIVNDIISNRTGGHKTKRKNLYEKINVLVESVTLAGDCKPTKKAKNVVKKHIIDTAVHEATNEIGRENY